MLKMATNDEVIKKLAMIWTERDAAQSHVTLQSSTTEHICHELPTDPAEHPTISWINSIRFTYGSMKSDCLFKVKQKE